MTDTLQNFTTDTLILNQTKVFSELLDKIKNDVNSNDFEFEIY